MGPIKGAALLAASAAAYALYEPYRFRLVALEVPVRDSGAGFSVLHVSDTHLTHRKRSLMSFLSGLPERLGERPDLVLATGDFVEDDSGIDPAIEALGRLDARLGRFFVLGSHDYYASAFRLDGYVKYFGGRRKPVTAARIDTRRLVGGLQDVGWTALTNSDAVVEDRGRRIRLAGVDDPYIRRHSLDHVHRNPEDSLAIGLMHGPDVVSEFALAGFDLVLAGHTHAGQVRIPGIGALVTNCSLPPEIAGGLSRVGRMWLHVSPGLGSARFGPIRFNCPPEATLLRLTSG
jgi:predicted MPP superfamily phosphohydrolase